MLFKANWWTPQRPLPEAKMLLGRIEEIVLRGRTRSSIPWLIIQCPAVIHKNALTKAIFRLP